MHVGARVLRVSPPLAAGEIDLLMGLAGIGPVLRIWPGQPSSRSPWLPCAGGCCLVAAPGRGVRAAEAWLRLLLRDVLAPVSSAALARGARFGMPGGHQVAGRVLVDGHLVVVRGSRVTSGRVRQGRTTGVTDPSADRGRGASRADDDR